MRVWSRTLSGRLCRVSLLFLEIWPKKITKLSLNLYICSIPLKQNINKPFFLCAQCMKTYMMGLLLEENKIFVLMFKVNFLGLGLLSFSFFFLFF
jgi:hypothetical protein